MTDISINDSNILNSDYKKEENFNYFKLVYIITTSIITFLGILIMIENTDLFFINSENKDKNLVLIYILFSTFSWLFILLVALFIFYIIKYYQKTYNSNDTIGNNISEMRCNINNNFTLNKSVNLNENLNPNLKDSNIINLINFNSNTEIKNLDNNIIGLYNNSNNSFKQSKLYLNENYCSNFKNVNNEKIQKNNLNTSLSENTLLNNFNNPSYKFKFIYLILFLIYYTIFTIYGIFASIKLVKEGIFKNYKLHYKIYLFVFLSLSKSSIIVIGFMYKFFSKKVELNSVKFEINEEFLREIEREIKEANEISGIISPEINLIKHNDMFNRHYSNKQSNFKLNESSNGVQGSNFNVEFQKNLINKKDNIIINNNHNLIDKDLNLVKKENCNSIDNILIENDIKKEINIFDFKIKEKINDDNDKNKKVNFKIESNSFFSKDKYNTSIFSKNHNDPKNDNEVIKKSTTIDYINKKSILNGDIDLINSKIDLEKIEPSK